MGGRKKYIPHGLDEAGRVMDGSKFKDAVAKGVTVTIVVVVEQDRRVVGSGSGSSCFLEIGC